MVRLFLHGDEVTSSAIREELTSQPPVHHEPSTPTTQSFRRGFVGARKAFNEMRRLAAPMWVRYALLPTTHAPGGGGGVVVPCPSNAVAGGGGGASLCHAMPAQWRDVSVRTTPLAFLTRLLLHHHLYSCRPCHGSIPFLPSTSAADSTCVPCLVLSSPSPGIPTPRLPVVARPLHSLSRLLFLYPVGGDGGWGRSWS
jgi:hypothetical protein